MNWNHPLIAANPMFMAMAWQSAMFSILMTPRKKPKQTAEVVSITCKADKLRLNKN